MASGFNYDDIVFYSVEERRGWTPEAQGVKKELYALGLTNGCGWVMSTGNHP